VRRLAFACVLAATLAGPSLAADVAPFDLYKAGQYEDAIKAGEAANTGQGLAVAARAAFAEGKLFNKDGALCATATTTCLVYSS